MSNQQQTNGAAIASLVLGIVSIVFTFIFFIVGLICGIVGIVLAVKAKKEIAASGQGGSGVATAGLVCSIIGLTLSGIYTLCAVAVGSALGCAGLSLSSMLS